MALRQAILVLYQEFPFALDAKTKENHYQKSTRALIRLLYAHPDYAFCLYLSRQEALWLNETHPESISILQEMVNRKQLEILGGPFDEPFLSMLPGADRIGQIEATTLWARETFKKKPRGAFLPHGIWEPQVPQWLKSSDFDYSFAPIELFEENMEEHALLPHAIEDMGKSLLVFPYYALDSRESSIEKAEKLVALVSDQDQVVSLLFQQGSVEWLSDFLTTIISKGLTLIHPSVYLKKRLGKTFPLLYLPASTAQNLGGGHIFYRHFLLKKREAQLLYARMLYTSLLARQMKKDKNIKKNALQALWQSQNHQLYWQSRYGGINHPQIRQWAYKNLLQADNIARSTGEVNYGLLRNDFDMQGSTEILYQGPKYNAFCQNKGALMFELDFLETEKTYLNTYDDQNPHLITKAFHDYFMPKETGFDAWASGTASKGIFHDDFYELSQFSGDRNIICYQIERPFEETLLSISKSYHFRQNGFKVHYNLSNKALVELEKKLGIEINLSLCADYRLLVNQQNAQGSIITDIREITIIDNDDTILNFRLSSPCTIWRQHLYNTVTIDGQNESVYQGESFIFNFDLKLEANKETSLTIDVLLSLHDPDHL